MEGKRFTFGGERITRGTLACRMHRIVDASLFCLSAKETAGKFSDPWSAGVMSDIQKGACAIQLLAMAITFLAPRFCKERHEVLKASPYLNPSLSHPHAGHTFLGLSTTPQTFHLTMIVMLLQCICQQVNFGTAVFGTWVTTISRQRYQIPHACNTLFSAINFLPGQVLVFPKLYAWPPAKASYC